jgi:malate dehydrogenase (quinone)
MFGPFASWTTRFLRHSGGWTDLPRSVRSHNVVALARAGLQNRSLVQYLVREGFQDMESRLRSVRRFYPNARVEDWRLVEAGIRVQAIKKSDRGAVYFGTEVFSSSDRSLAALLGASPGASVSVSVALEVIRTCLPHLLEGVEARDRMGQMIPSHDVDLKQPGSEAVFERIRRGADERLGLMPVAPVH